MAETAGENIVFIILFVIFIFIIVLVFAYFLLFGFGFSNASSCYVSSQISNFFYNGLCATQFFCIASTLQSLEISPPLLGCSPSTQSYSSGSTTGQAFSAVTQSLATCWYQYGGSEGLSVLPGVPVTGNPQTYGNGSGLCSVINLHLGQNATFYNLTRYLQSATQTTKLSCLNHTAAQSCDNPLSASNPYGFYCDNSYPTECQATSFNYFKCLSAPGGYVGGSNLQSIFLNKNGVNAKTTAAINATAQLCDASQGCFFNAAFSNSTYPDGACFNGTDQAATPSACTQVYTNFCQNISVSGGKFKTNYNCTMNYDSSFGELSPPSSCTLTEPVKNTSTVNVSYFDYLNPGVDLLYSYKNRSTGSSSLVSIYSNISISNTQLYLVFLNSFAGTSYPPQLVSTPKECWPAVFLNNYPNNGIADSCTRALLTFGAAGISTASAKPGLVTYSAAAGAGFLYGRCIGNTVCDKYIATPAVNAFSTLVFTTSGVSSCAQSLYVGLQETGNSVSNDWKSFWGWLSGSTYTPSNLNFLGRNQLYLCAVSS
ncbi:MAG: hypothetical protein M1348_01795 [Candidatus Parvarchaeota archaeon]|nr:hypothetical protein [Candidatus Parvarchaeota archaeon]MCL5101324.1 hypothetical protein [Candidatus Parvarchaeota archaeon]